MANNLLTSSVVVNEALDVLENQLVMANNVNREYDPKFGVAGAKVGYTVNVPRPSRYIGTTGPALAVEDTNQTSSPVTLTTQFHVDVSFTTADLTLSLNDFSERCAKPAMAAIANKIDLDTYLYVKNNTAQAVGSVSAAPSLLTVLNAAAILDTQGAPRDGRRAVIIDPFTGASLVDSLKGLFVPPNTIAEQFRTGQMGKDSGGANWYQSANVVAHQYGAWATTAGTLTANTATFTGSITSGYASSTTLTLTNSQTLTLNKGDTFTIAGVYAANPQNRLSTGKLQSFVVQSTVTATAGTFVASITPAIITAGQFQNVVVTATSATATVTPFSLAGTTATAASSPQGLLLHPNSFTLAMADLELPRGQVDAKRATSKNAGMSIRMVTAYTINNDAMPTRFDVLYGVASLYPELSVRIAAAPPS